MKKVYTFLIGFLCLATYAHATNYVWVGAPGAKYSDPANWSLTGVAGSGGAGVPGPGDGVSFSFFSTGQRTFLVNMDASPTVSILSIGTAVDVTLVTSINTTFTVTNQFTLNGSLLDSTSENVMFNLVLNGATGNFTSSTNALTWSFAGRVPVSSGNGAMFSAINGASVTIGNPPAGYDPIRVCNVIFRQNSGQIVSSVSTLRFNAGTNYILENNLNGSIPAATWAPAQGAEVPTNDRYIAAPIIQINGDARTITHFASAPQYGSIYVDLYALSGDADLALPNGTVLSQYLNVYNTNNRTLTLLNAAGADSAVVKVVGSVSQPFAGSFNMGGATSKVALARAATPSTSYRLEVRDFNQNAGNFSLQDANAYTGSSTLTVRRYLNETGGTFLTNSTAAAPARFAVEFVGPNYVDAPSGPQFYTHQINLTSGVMNSPANLVTLRVRDIPFTYFYTGNQTSPIGANLGNSLQVGRLELNGGPIFGGANVLTVTNPAADAIKITAANSYVNGTVRRATNATTSYMMPTGKGTQFVFNLDTCAIIPASAAPSVYQAEYFNTRYSDTMVAAPFRGVDTTQYWDITKVSGADAQVQLFLTKPVPRAAATDNLVVAHYVGGKWVSEQGTIFSPGNAATGSVTSKVLSSFSPFTFGYGAFVNAPLPIHLISFDGHAENGAARLNWKVAEPAARFEVLRSADGINFSQVGTVQVSNLQQQYSYLDGGLPAGNNFYRLRSVEKDGNTSLSDVIMVNSTGQITELMTLAPTVVRSSASLRINAVKDGQLQLVVTDMSGRSWKKLVLAVRAGSSASLVNFSDLPAGTYQISGYLDGKQTAAIRFIKQ